MATPRRKTPRRDARTAQHRPDALRVVKIPVPIGSGAQRDALHVLWPRVSVGDDGAI